MITDNLPVFLADGLGVTNVVPLNVVPVTTPVMLTLSKFVCPSTSNSTKSPLPTNVVAVTTPDILTLSKFV